MSDTDQVAAGKRKLTKAALIRSVMRLIRARRKSGLSTADLIKWLVKRMDKGKLKVRIRRKGRKGTKTEPAVVLAPPPATKPHLEVGKPLEPYKVEEKHAVIPVAKKEVKEREEKALVPARVINLLQDATEDELLAALESGKHLMLEGKSANKATAKAASKYIKEHAKEREGKEKAERDAKHEREEKHKAKEEADKLKAEKKAREDEEKKAKDHDDGLRRVLKKYDRNALYRMATAANKDDKGESFQSPEEIRRMGSEALIKFLLDAGDVTISGLYRGQHGKGRKLPLSTTDIDESMSHIPGYMGAVPSDGKLEIPENPPRDGVSWVMNLDAHDQPGSHWVAILITPHSAEYYNSLGDPPSNEVEKKIHIAAHELWPGHKKTFKINLVPHQDQRTATCGLYAMKFIHDRLSGKSFMDATGYKPEIRKHEAEVKEFDEKYPKFVQIGGGFLTLQDGPTDAVKRTLGRIGDWQIHTMTVWRKPISSAIGTVLNLVSLGGWKKALAQMGYDKMFHLAMYIRVSAPGSQGANSELFRVEKNATVQLTRESGNHIPEGRNIDTMVAKPDDRTGKSDLTVNQLFSKQHEKGFWLYDPFTNNCQDFILKLLGSTKYLTPKVREFIKQDAEEIGKKLGWFTRAVGKAVTDLGGRVDNAVDSVKNATGQNDKLGPDQAAPTEKPPETQQGGALFGERQVGRVPHFVLPVRKIKL